MSSEPKKITIKRKEIPLQIEHEDGTEHAYTLREMKGGDRDTYLNKASKKVKLGADGKPVTIADHTGLCSDLLAMTVYDAQNNLVSYEVISSWPSSAQMELWKMALELCGLAAGATEAAKND